MKQLQTIKRSVLVLQTILLLIVCLTANCYSGQGGELHPQPGEGYSIVKKVDGWEAASLIFGETSVRIEGSWSEGGIGNTFRIENNSVAPFTLDFAQVKIKIQGEETGKPRITALYDYSTSASKSEFETFDKGVKLYEYYGNKYNGKPEFFGDSKAVCPPKQKCIFSINVVFPETKLNRDKSIKITLPATLSGSKETEVFFNLRRNSVWDSLTAQTN